MILENFTQDVRVGLRILFKEKTFFVLSVLVLALGIGGAMTQFAVVNAIVLRGFSFPHPEQLVSVGLIDPKASDQNNNFGNGNIPAAQDYEDIRAAQKSFAMTAGYLSGSTINVTYNNNPARYTGAYITDDLFKIVGVFAHPRPRLHRRRQQGGRPEDRDPRRQDLAARFQCRSDHRRPKRYD